jgi:predicted NBD/HSP70 family sugar kinase
MDSQKTAAKPGRNATGVRAMNAKTVLNIVRTEKAVSRAEIARLTGLSPPAVSAIVNELEIAGYLEKKSRRVSGVGTPSTLYGIARGAALSLGIHIGRRSTTVLLLDFADDVVGATELSYDVPRVAQVKTFVNSTIAAWQASTPDLTQRLVGTGVCSPRFFDYSAEDLGYSAAVVADWRAFDSHTAFPELSHQPIFEENDANAAALAELEWGSGGEIRNFFYIYIGTFIGGGLVLDGRLVRGAQGLAATFGPFPVSKSQLSSSAAGDRDTEYLFRRASLYVLLNHLRHGGIAIDRESALENPDPAWASLCAEWSHDASQAIAQAIQGAVAIIDVEAVVIDSPLGLPVLETLVSKVRSDLNRNADRMIVMPRLLIGSAGRQASARGAAMVPFNEVLGAGRFSSTTLESASRVVPAALERRLNP